MKNLYKTGIQLGLHQRISFVRFSIPPVARPDLVLRTRLRLQATAVPRHSV